MHRRGFSLLELLVVISIIGILVAMGAVAYSTAQKKGRDARRTGDMKAIQSAMEQHYATEGAYPDTIGAAELVAILGPAPSDPGSNTYTYADVNLTTTGYCICAELESGVGNADAAAGADTCTFDNSGNETFFCVGNLQ